MTSEQPFDEAEPMGDDTLGKNGEHAGRFPPGHAWFVVDGDQESDAILVACGERSRLDALLGHVEFNLRARSLTVVIENVAVPVVVVMLRIAGEGETALFSAWINELSPRAGGVLESLATQAQVQIVLVDEQGRTGGTAMARNVLAQRMEGSRGWITKLAQTSPWTRHQFSAAKAYIRSQHPTNEDLWARFDEDSANELKEFDAVPA